MQIFTNSLLLFFIYSSRHEDLCVLRRKDDHGKQELFRFSPNKMFQQIQHQLTELFDMATQPETESIFMKIIIMSGHTHTHHIHLYKYRRACSVTHPTINCSRFFPFTLLCDVLAVYEELIEAFCFANEKKGSKYYSIFIQSHA